MRIPLADKARQLTGFVNFKINKRKLKDGTLDRKTKRLINDYHKVIYGYEFKDETGKTHYEPGLANGLKYLIKDPKPAHTAKGRAKQALERKARQALAGQPNHEHLVGVWFDTVQGPSGRLLKPRIGRNRKGELYYEVNRVRFGFVKLNKRRMATDPEAELDRALAQHPNVKAWAIKCGKAQSKQQESRSTVKAKVIAWQNQYTNWGEWLTGLVPMQFTKQKSFRAYRAARDATLKNRTKSHRKGK